MDFNFQALFSHINVTNDQMKAILQDFWRKNEENQAEIGRLQQKEVENQGEIMRLRQEIDERENHETSIESELDARSNIIEELERKNNEQEKQKSELERQNCELDRKYSELLVMYSECQRKNGMLESEIEEQKPSCPVCLLNFDTEARQPYALSCPHMVSARCLYPALERERYHQHDIDIQGGSHPSRRCPICRTRVNTRLKKICLQS